MLCHLCLKTYNPVNLKELNFYSEILLEGKTEETGVNIIINKLPLTLPTLYHTLVIYLLSRSFFSKFVLVFHGILHLLSSSQSLNHYQRFMQGLWDCTYMYM